MNRRSVPSPRVPRPTPNLVPLSLALAALAAASAATGCDTTGATEDDPTEQVQSAVVANLSIVGRVALPGLLATPGITVTLAGAQQQTVVTDANGAFRFQVPPGSYSLRPSKTGATFTPDVVNVNNLSASVIQDFTCAGACGGTTAVVAGKELVITDPTVLNDARASNATDGPWSFRAMIEQMAPVGTDPADFAAAWLATFEFDGTLNGFRVFPRLATSIRLQWPTTANGKLDMSKAPFKLISIVNRQDLHAGSNGEGRFVYGLFDLNGNGLLMTVIFEYGLPAKDAGTGATLTRKSWATKFHALGTQAFGAPYNAALQSVTDLFTRRGTSPLKPGGSSINQVRSNEIQTGLPWQLREFNLNTTGGPLALRLVTTGNTPVNDAFRTTEPPNAVLASYINTDAVLIHGAYTAVPLSITGGSSDSSFFWNNFSVPVDERSRHDFAGQTCNGCHFSEVNNPQTGTPLNTGGFYQIAPINDTSPDGTARLSPFIKDFEIPRRTKFMQNVLTCSGSGCAAGAEATFL
jgi:Carboxypeptidase regulatory-like domain